MRLPGGAALRTFLHGRKIMLVRSLPLAALHLRCFSLWDAHCFLLKFTAATTKRGPPFSEATCRFITAISDRPTRPTDPSLQAAHMHTHPRSGWFRNVGTGPCSPMNKRDTPEYQSGYPHEYPASDQLLRRFRKLRKRVGKTNRESMSRKNPRSGSTGAPGLASTPPSPPGDPPPTGPNQA